MSSRDTILSAIRSHKPSPRPLPDVPLFDMGRTDDLVGRFTTALEAMGGKLVQTRSGDPLDPIRERAAQGSVVVSMVPGIFGNRSFEPSAPPSSLADVDLAIVRAAFGVAETGSVGLTERELGINTLAYLAQHLIVLLDPADILVNLHHAYRRREFADARYMVFHTGPSATADIEGILVHGAQGVRSLSVAMIGR